MELLDDDKLAHFVRSIVIETKPDREWLNAKQSANYLGVSVVTLREWRRKYKIPSRTIENVTRWKKSDLDAFWKRRGVEGYL